MPLTGPPDRSELAAGLYLTSDEVGIGGKIGYEINQKENADRKGYQCSLLS